MPSVYVSTPFKPLWLLSLIPYKPLWLLLSKRAVYHKTQKKSSTYNHSENWHTITPQHNLILMSSSCK